MARPRPPPPPAISATLPVSPARSSRNPMGGSSPKWGGGRPSAEGRSVARPEAEEGDAVVAVVEHRLARKADPQRGAIDLDHGGRDTHPLRELDHGQELRDVLGEGRGGRLL